MRSPPRRSGRSAEGAEQIWPSVAVVIPTRDRPAAVARAVASVLQSSYEGEIEALVVFDQTAPSPIPVSAGPGRSLRTLPNARRPGLAGARNTGLLAAQADLVAFCDDDDQWVPEKLYLQVEALRRHPDAELAVGGIQLIYRGRSFERIPDRERIGVHELVRSRHTELHPSTFLAWRDAVLEGIGLIDEGIPGSYGEDYEWLLRASQRSPIVAVQRPLVRVEWSGSSWFAERWSTIIDAIAYLLDRHPVLRSDPQGLARLYGRTAFAHAALGQRRAAIMWATRALRLSALEPRGYLTLAVACGLVSTRTALALARRFGRGI